MNQSTPNWGTPPWTISFRPKRKSLPHEVDFAIVGAGFSGLSAAACLKRLAPKNSVIVLEAGSLGNGASGRTGGLALSQTAAGNLPGLGNVLGGYKKILRELGVKADLDLRGVWEIARGPRSMEGKKIRPLKHSPIDWADSGRVRAVKKVPGGTVDPGKVISGLARAAEKAGVSIFTNTSVLEVQPGSSIRIAVNHNGRKSTIAASRVLFATNAGGLAQTEKHFDMENRSSPKLTFALATAPLTKKQLVALGMKSGRPFYSVDLPYLWGRLLRNGGMIFGSGLVPGFGELLPKSRSKKLWSGLEHEDVCRGDSAQRLEMLEQRVRGLHPAMQNIRITHRWGGPILLTQDFVPLFRRHAKHKNLILLGGFSGHGVAQSVYLGKWAAEGLLDKRTLPRWSFRK
jgi:gamma-glutamylputrescine oxidase